MTNHPRWLTPAEARRPRRTWRYIVGTVMVAMGFAFFAVIIVSSLVRVVVARVRSGDMAELYAVLAIVGFLALIFGGWVLRDRDEAINGKEGGL